MASLEELNAAIKEHRPIAASRIVAESPELLTQRDAKGRTPVTLMAAEGDNATLKVALKTQQGREALSIADNNGYLPLHFAAASGNVPAVRDISEANKERQAADKKERQAAAKKKDAGKEEIAAPYIAKDDIDRTNRKQFTPAMSAVYSGHADAYEALTKNGAAKIGDKEIKFMRGNALQQIESLKDKTDRDSQHELGLHKKALSDVNQFAAELETKRTAALAKVQEAKIAAEQKLADTKSMKRIQDTSVLNNLGGGLTKLKPDTITVDDLHSKSTKTKQPSMPPFDEAHIARATLVKYPAGYKPEKSIASTGTDSRPTSSSASSSKSSSSTSVSSTSSYKPEFRTAASTQEGYGVGASGKKTGEFKLSFRNKGVELSEGNTFTAQDAATLMANGYHPVKFPDNKYRFTKDAKPESISSDKQRTKSIDHDTVRPIPLNIERNPKFASVDR